MKHLLFLILLLVSVKSHAQTGREQVPKHYPIVELLGVEYEIKDVPEPDQARLILIPYEEISMNRLKESNVEIFDPNSNYTIVLYSDVICEQNKH